MASRKGTLPVAYDRELYEYEKMIGKRLTSGKKPLKALSARHRQIIALHVQGYSNNSIATILDMSHIAVSHVLTDPLTQSVLSTFKESWVAELAALGALAVDAVREGLLSQDKGVALRAADQFFKTQGTYKQDANAGNETAEDVISRVLTVMEVSADAVRQAAISQRRPTKIIDTSARNMTDGRDQPGNNEASD